MGLATVFGIVKMSGGWIEVDSQPSDGTTFRAYFPEVADELRPHMAGVADDPPVAGSETVLLVEDDPAVRSFARRCLLKLGYKVIEARTGAEALALVADGRPIDLLLTDVAMPGLQGSELRRRLRELRPGLRTLFVSGFAQEKVLSDADDADRADLAYLAKPYTLEALARAVRAVLEGRQ
jgi:two-component system cell cycle sensor histidine kinase/response regulator CckA